MWFLYYQQIKFWSTKVRLSQWTEVKKKNDIFAIQFNTLSSLLVWLYCILFCPQIISIQSNSCIRVDFFCITVCFTLWNHTALDRTVLHCITMQAALYCTAYHCTTKPSPYTVLFCTVQYIVSTPHPTPPTPGRSGVKRATVALYAKWSVHCSELQCAVQWSEVECSKTTSM